jgi:hypothetical protein
MQTQSALFGRSPSNGLVSDMSQGDFTDTMPHVGGTGGLNIEFFYARIRTEDPSDPSKNGQYATKLCIAKQPKGDRLTIATRFITERQAQQQFPREFAYFKQNQDVPTDGTPLNELPSISASQIGILVVHGVRCIEDLVALPQETVNGMGMDAQAAYTLAKRWTAKRDENGDLIAASQKEATQTAELARLRKSEQDSAALIAQLKAQVDILGRMPGSQARDAVTSAGGSGALAVDNDDLPENLPDDGFFTGGDMARGADDLDDGPTKEDPLSLKRGKK